MVNIAVLGQETWDPAMAIDEQIRSQMDGLEGELTDQVGAGTGAVVVINGEEGTIPDIQRAYNEMIPIVGVGSTGGVARRVAGRYLSQKPILKGVAAELEDCVKTAWDLGNNRAHLVDRLTKVGLDLHIYQRVPTRFIRLRPNGIGAQELADKMRQKFKIDLYLAETEFPSIYEVSVDTVGWKINGVVNPFLNWNYALQDPTSMLSVLALDLEGGQNYLEIGAAPGAKIMNVHDCTDGDVYITAIDWDVQRLKILRRIIGYCDLKTNLIVMDARDYNTGEEFERVMVDVSSSNEGIQVKWMNEDMRYVSSFQRMLKVTPGDVEALSDADYMLLQNGFNHLKEGGVMVYCTGALNLAETEGVVQRLLDENNNARVDIDYIDMMGIKCTRTDTGIRIHPGRTYGGFISRIIKVN